ncbi:MAG: FkbM family methyltransferase [Methylicorpusculum sp.]|nr:FkbM family methyltransferase [Methylicorpusculum sp.]MDP3531053.1 FkbM family methyltransferase [Methylicorpusculum sp.]
MNPHFNKTGRRLVCLKLKVKDKSIQFNFRNDSRGDLGVILQIFHCDDYSVDNWCQGHALIRYHQIHLPEDLVIIDAGANIGGSATYLDAVFPNCNIVAIEPEPGNCEIARLNCKHTKFKLIEAALGQKSGTLYLHDLGRSDWGFQVRTVGQHPVKVVTIPDLFDQYCINATPFILKIDIEGAEQMLFADKSDWLDRFALVVIELHDWMQPGDAVSCGFYREISRYDFDILQRGENTFCFNNRLLREYYK